MKEVIILKVEDCAKEMNCSPQFLRVCLQEGKVPFGLAVRMSEKWTYWIDEAMFWRWLKGGKVYES